MRTTKKKVAALQLSLEIGRVPNNVDKCLSQLEKALKAGAEIVALPEFASTPICLADAVRACAMPADIVLTGRDGRYDLAFHARAGSAPVRPDLTATDLLAHFGAC